MWTVWNKTSRIGRLSLLLSAEPSHNRSPWGGKSGQTLETRRHIAFREFIFHVPIVTPLTCTPKISVYRSLNLMTPLRGWSSRNQRHNYCHSSIKGYQLFGTILQCRLWTTPDSGCYLEEHHSALGANRWSSHPHPHSKNTYWRATLLWMAPTNQSQGSLVWSADLRSNTIKSR